MKNTQINGAACQSSGPEGYARKLMSSPDKITDDFAKIDNALLLARPLNSSSILTFSSIDDELSCIKGIGETTLMVSLNAINVTFTGEWEVEIFPLSQITTLLSFLDYQTKSEGAVSRMSVDPQRKGVILEDESCIIACVEENCKSFMDMLISNILIQNKQSLKNIFAFIRNMESYWVTKFLLSQVLDEDKEKDIHKLYNACKVYGVSESYFRKLCYDAFTRSPKKQLRMWRAAHSALQLIEKDKSIATIAGNNGYASSSHFSSEIKSLFGITPRAFKRLEGFLNE